MTDYVIKFFTDRPDKLAFMREVEILSKLNHPCVVRILRWGTSDRRLLAEIHTERAKYGSLADILGDVNQGTAPDFWNLTRIGIIICDIVFGMRYVHSRGIIHRDLKPSNILVNQNRRAWVAGFGTNRFKDDDSTPTGETGTVHYAAPEQWAEDAECTTKIDVWSFGLILYEILTGQAVFRSTLEPMRVLKRMRRKDLPTLPSKYGDYIQSLISRCWCYDPADRPSFGDICDEFQTRHFALFAGADFTMIEAEALGVMAWEVQASCNTTST
jgi:serine/threonine protein kinase